MLRNVDFIKENRELDLYHETGGRAIWLINRLLRREQRLPEPKASSGPECVKTQDL